MTNGDDFWKKQFGKHEATVHRDEPTAKAVPAEPSAKTVKLGSYAAVTTEDSRTSRLEKILLAGRSSNSQMSFEAFASLVLSKVPVKTKGYWERWLLTWRTVLVERWRLSESPKSVSDDAVVTK